MYCTSWARFDGVSSTGNSVCSSGFFVELDQAWEWPRGVRAVHEVVQLGLLVAQQLLVDLDRVLEHVAVFTQFLKLRVGGHVRVVLAA
jgi:hypothetical protein